MLEDMNLPIIDQIKVVHNENKLESEETKDAEYTRSKSEDS